MYFKILSHQNSGTPTAPTKWVDAHALEQGALRKRQLAAARRHRSVRIAENRDLGPSFQPPLVPKREIRKKIIVPVGSRPSVVIRSGCRNSPVQRASEYSCL